MSARRIAIPKSILRKTISEMRQAGNHGMEWFGLWLAKQQVGSVTSIAEVYFPQQYSSSAGGRVIILEEELQKLNRYLYEKKLQIAAQIHSHPKEAFHSWIDDEECIATREGSYSIVVPYFGRLSYHDISKFAFFRLESRNWIGLERDEIRDTFEVV